ncbi:MAG TPA: serine hydrolase domain-containing protein [Phycisphaerae bacterium]|nr:serine hydrolase domain-containing protein [Phycisphaerae bacterium]
MSALSRTVAILQDGLSAGLHIGAQLFALIDGRPVADLALGLARPAAAGESPTPMSSDTLMLWLSAGKPVTAVAIAMLADQGLLSFDDPVARHLPEFAQNGKETITIRHLLTHTAGIRALDTAYPFQSWDDTLAKIFAMRLERDWTPGERAGYHTHTSWYLLGEILQRLARAPIDHWIRRHIFEPLRMSDSWLAMPADRYHADGNRIGILMDTSNPQQPKPMMNLDTELAASRPRPSASCRGPMHDLARFYEMMRRGGELDGVRLLQESTARRLISRQRVGMLDATFRQKIDWGFGFILNSSHHGPGIPYQFGPRASPDTFGHGGSQSSSAFCDPDRRLVVALIFNGCPGEPAHDRRLRATLTALYEDLFGPATNSL